MKRIVVALGVLAVALVLLTITRDAAPADATSTVHDYTNVTIDPGCLLVAEGTAGAPLIAHTGLTYPGRGGSDAYPLDDTWRLGLYMATPEDHANYFDRNFYQIIPSASATFDLGAPLSEVYIALSQDHGPYPEDAIDYRLAVSNDNMTYTTLPKDTPITMYRRGWSAAGETVPCVSGFTAEPPGQGTPPGWPYADTANDDWSVLWHLPSPARFVQLTPLSSDPIYNDPEIDAVMGLGTIEIGKKEVEIPGGECEGRMDSITLELSAAPDEPVTVIVKDGERVLNFPAISIGDTFTIDSEVPGQKFNKMDQKLTVVKDGTTLTEDLKVHVSCSHDPFIGQTDEKDGVVFTTVAWNSIEGGPAPPGPPIVIGPLAGATFSVSPNPGFCVTDTSPFSVTDNGPNDANPADGAIELNHVCLGTYAITETGVPPDFAAHPDPTTCNVNASGSPSSSSPCTVTVSQGNLLASVDFFNVAVPPPECKKGSKMDSVTLELTDAPDQPVTVIVKDDKRVLNFTGISIGDKFTIDSEVPGKKFKKADLKLTVVKDGKKLTKDLKVHVSCSDKPVAGVSTDTKNGVKFTIMDFTTVGKKGKK